MCQERSACMVGPSRKGAGGGEILRSPSLVFPARAKTYRLGPGWEQRATTSSCQGRAGHEDRAIG
ncbi:MAG: hypothetical protein AVDCRST_MAG76-2531 [uncultured Acidimicrobiales bacterium]|uniref:Uncharacterized protein n=1 Tax=uncultured Acidimicrobiales bacterium TaxID=310071 RepID=A0A6J4IQR2_9ACTN|nr:MAG: hypothetical protein AVDCRST_MAG76-2531 [uncultured Acidimicrobiales bacterium]